MEIFLVKVFTEGKKVVGKAFLSKKRFLVESRGFFIHPKKGKKKQSVHPIESFHLHPL
jgi:hypothetical protein